MAKTGRPRNDEQIELALRLVQDGKSLREVGKILNVSHTRIAYITREYGTKV